MSSLGIQFRRTSGPSVDQSSRALNAAIKASLAEVLDSSINSLKTVLPRDRGGLVASVAGNIATTQDSLTASITMNDYAVPLEMGLPVGDTGGATIEALTKWAIRKGITTNPEHAVIIAKRILTKWTKEGRAAKGFLGLATPGEVPASSFIDELEPIPGGIIDRIFRRMEEALVELERELFR